MSRPVQTLCKSAASPPGFQLLFNKYRKYIHIYIQPLPAAEGAALGQQVYFNPTPQVGHKSPYFVLALKSNIWLTQVKNNQILKNPKLLRTFAFFCRRNLLLPRFNLSWLTLCDLCGHCDKPLFITIFLWSPLG